MKIVKLSAGVISEFDEYDQTLPTTPLISSGPLPKLINSLQNAKNLSIPSNTSTATSNLVDTSFRTGKCVLILRRTNPEYYNTMYIISISDPIY